MIHSTTNFHDVVAIKVDATRIGPAPGFISTQFTFTTKDGSRLYISAFSSDHLQIDGAEHVNHVAAPMGDPDEYREEESA